MNSVQRYFKLDNMIFQKLVDEVFESKDLLYYTQKTDEQLKKNDLLKHATIYLVKKEFLNQLKIDCAGKNKEFAYIDEEVSYVVELFYPKNNILRSRIKYNRFYFDEEYNKVMKSDEFIKWADSIVKEVVKCIAKYNKNNTL